MTLRPDVQFRSGFPDDTVENGDDIVEWPGRNIAEALKAALERLGYRVSEPVSMEHVGWELDIGLQRRAFCLRINVIDADECYLMASNSTIWLPDAKLFRSLLADLQRILKEDGRFVVVGWFPKGGIDRNLEPAAAPFDS